MSVVRALACAASAVLVSVILATSDANQASAATKASVEMQPGLVRAAVGEAPVSVTIQVANLAHQACVGDAPNCAPSVGMAGFDFKIRYDDDVVAVRRVEGGPDLGKTGRTFNCLNDHDEENNLYTFACYSSGEAEGLQGSMVLARVEIAPVGPGEAFLELTGQLAGRYSEDIPADFKRSAVIVRSSPASAGENNRPLPGDPVQEPAFGTVLPNGTFVDEDGNVISAQEAAATATAVRAAEGSEGDEDDSAQARAGQTPGAGGGDGEGDDADNSNASDGDDDGGGGFVTVLLISLGVIAGAVALGAGGLAALRIRNGG
jgi:hypothetical protein